MFYTTGRMTASDKNILKVNNNNYFKQFLWKKILKFKVLSNLNFLWSPEWVQIFKEFENLSVEKKMLSTALGFEPRSFDCWSIPENNISLIRFGKMWQSECL